MSINNDNINILNINITDEYLLFNHNFLKDDLKKCLNLVKDYILENELMIVGGMAIDLSLRSKNTYLYNENLQIPDYDVISPDNVLHANNIGNILCNNKFKNISIIPALHKTTVRVQMSGYTLFDSTFIPKNIYNKIPFMKYNNFKFIHPIYQKIDQYTSLSFLFEITGQAYNITHRMKKDIIRKNLLNKYYSIKINDININNLKSYKFNSINIDLNVFNNTIVNKIKIFNKDKLLYNEKNLDLNNFKNYLKDINKDDNFYSIDCNITHHGIFGFSILYRKFIDVINEIKEKKFIKEKDLDIIINLENEIIIKTSIITSNKTVKIQIPNNIPFVLINNNNHILDINNNLNNIYKIPQVKNFEGMSTSIPNYSSSNIKIDEIDLNLQIFDLYGKLLAINIIEIDNVIYNISNYNYNLSYFLFNYYMNTDEEVKNIYLAYYISLINIIKIINFINIEYNDEIKKNNINIKAFLYSINTLGFENYSENYYYFIKNFNNLVKENKNLSDLPPKNYIGFPDCYIKKEFIKENSSFYNEFHKEILDTNFKNELDIIKKSI